MTFEWTFLKSSATSWNFYLSFHTRKDDKLFARREKASEMFTIHEFFMLDSTGNAPETKHFALRFLPFSVFKVMYTDENLKAFLHYLSFGMRMIQIQA
jgi:hypothetical protein